MTGHERLNKWWKGLPYSAKPLDFWTILGFMSGYAQGCTDGGAMRGRCKQCADKISDGTGVTGVVKRKRDELTRLVQDFTARGLGRDQENSQLRRSRDEGLRREARQEEALKVYRRAMGEHAQDAVQRVWRIVSPEFPQGLEFTGRALDVMEFFTKRTAEQATLNALPRAAWEKRLDV